jgi:hypothetical protein
MREWSSLCAVWLGLSAGCSVSVNGMVTAVSQRMVKIQDLWIQEPNCPLDQFEKVYNLFCLTASGALSLSLSLRFSR